MNYPLLLSAKGIVMDGVHRIAKARLLGHEDIAAVRFPEDPQPDQVKYSAQAVNFRGRDESNG